jgi:fibronectin-binding autotransporter adhesin
MKHLSTHHFHRGVRKAAPSLAAAVALVLTASASAQSLTWVGNGTAPDWSQPINWDANVIPLDFDALTFGAAGSTGSVLNNDLPIDRLINGITFSATASPFTFNGNRIILLGDVINNSLNTQTIQLPLVVDAQRTFTTTNGGGNIVLGGIISGAGGVTHLTTAVGTPPGTLTLGNTANTYTGLTVFNPGIINVASLSDYGVASSIGARDALQETATGNGIGLQFRGGTLQYTGSTPQSTNRQIRVLNGAAGGFIDASGSTPEATLSFTHTGPNINLFETAGTRTLTLTGTNTGRNTFSIRLTDQAANQTTLQKTGSGTWYIVNSDNTYTGETIIGGGLGIGGILNVATLSDYGVVSSIGGRTFAQENTTVTGVSLHFRGGTLQYTGSTPQSTNRQIRILNGDGAFIDASGSTPEATLSFTKTGANLNLFDTGGARTLTLTGTNTGDNSFSIQLTNQSTNTTGLRKEGPGKWIITGPDTNTATGATTVNGGTLVLAKTNATAANGAVVVGSGLGTAVLQIGGTGGNQIADSSIVTFNGSGPDAGILRLAGFNETVGGLSSFGGSGIIENEAGAAGTATLTVNITGAQEYSGILRNGDGAGTDGILALTKTGPGTLTLAGTTTHSGPTVVDAGTLTINGTLGAATTLSVTNSTLNGSGTVEGTVNVGTSGTIASFGTFTGTVNLNNGSVLAGSSSLAVVNANSGSRISPGGANGVGTLSIGVLTLSSGSVLDYELDLVSDLVTITNAGGLALNGGSFNLFSAGGLAPLSANGTYTLFDYTNNFVGSLANLSIANSQIGKFYSLSNDTTTTRILLTVADATITEWNAGAADGKWTTPANWTAGAPNAPGAVAKFGPLPMTPSTIAVDGGKTVGGILFDNGNSYTITGGATDTITMSNGVAAATITVMIGNHTISAPMVLATSANAATATGTTLTLNGNISGDRAFIASGSGTTILNGTNTYGSTSVAGGTLQVSNGGTSGSLGTGDVTVDNGATLVFNRSNDIAVANNISGAGAQVTKLGAGTLTLSGNNTFATVDGGSFNLNEGTVRLTNSTALPSGVMLGVNGGTLDLNSQDTVLNSLTGSGGNITDSSATAGTSLIRLNQLGTTTYAGTITNGAVRNIALTKAGAGTLTLIGANTFKGPLTITDGTVIAAAASGPAIVSNVTLGDGSNAVMLTAGATSQQFGPETVVTFANGSRNAKLQLRGSTQTLAGIDGFADSTVTLAIVQNDEAGTPGFTAAPGPATLILNTTTDHSFTGLIRNQVGGGLHLVKEGPATQEIRNALVSTNNISSLTVNAGTLLLNFIANGGNTNTFVSGPANSAPVPFVINSGGTLGLDGATVIPGLVPATETAVGSAGVTISGNGIIRKQGPGSARINSSNLSFTGTVIVDSGILEVGNNEALGAPTAQIRINGGNLRAAGATREIPNPVSIHGDFTLGRQTNLNGNITLAADVTLTANNPDGTFNTTSALGPVSGPFRLTIQQGSFGMGAGAIIINGQNTNSGGTTITSGRVRVSAVGSLANADLAVNGGELIFENGAQSVTGFSGSGGTVNLGFGHTLTVQQEVARTYAGALTGSGTIVKRGAGALTLSGTSSNFGGAATVEEGTLLANGAFNASVSISGDTAVLGGNGSVFSATLANGGTLNPGGATPGILTAIGDITFGAGTRLRLDIDQPLAGVGYDQLSLLGLLSLSDTTLNIGGSYFTPVGGDLFFVVLNNGFGPVTGTFAGLPEGSLVTGANGQQYLLSYSANSDTLSFSGGNDIALQAIPEPSVAALLGGCAALLGMRRRRLAPRT